MSDLNKFKLLIESKITELGNQDMRSWVVYIKNNYYSGKYYDYSARPYVVIASSAAEAEKVVLDNAEEILNDLKSRKLDSGRRLLSPQHTLPITQKEIGAIYDGTVKKKQTTLKPRQFFTPTGVQVLSLENGHVVRDENEDSELSESYDSQFELEVYGRMQAIIERYADEQGIDVTSEEVGTAINKLAKQFTMNILNLENLV